MLSNNDFAFKKKNSVLNNLYVARLEALWWPRGLWAVVLIGSCLRLARLSGPGEETNQELLINPSSPHIIQYVDITAVGTKVNTSVIPPFNTSDLTQPPCITLSLVVSSLPLCLLTHLQIMSIPSNLRIHIQLTHTSFSLRWNVTLRWLSFISRALQRCFIVNNSARCVCKQIVLSDFMEV